MNNPDKPVGKVSVKIIIRTILFLALIIAVIFISAGRLDYWQGWAYVGLSILFLILSYLLLSSELIHERLKPENGVKNWDKIFQKVSVPIFIAILVISSLDGGRFKLVSSGSFLCNHHRHSGLHHWTDYLFTG